MDHGRELESLECIDSQNSTANVEYFYINTIAQYAPVRKRPIVAQRIREPVQSKIHASNGNHVIPTVTIQWLLVFYKHQPCHNRSLS